MKGLNGRNDGPEDRGARGFYLFATAFVAAYLAMLLLGALVVALVTG